MNTTNRYRLASLALMAALALTACSNSNDNKTTDNENLAHAVATAPAAPEVQSTEEAKPADQVVHNADGSITLGGNTFFPEAAAATIKEPVATSKPKAAAMPDDGIEYKMDLAAMSHAIQTQQPGDYVGLPTGFTTTGYPIFPATCTFYDDHSECEVRGQVVDEAYLANKVVVMRNIDVLNTAAHTCGTEICVDNDGNVIGHVSKQMIAWRKANCTWDPYGTAKCRQ